MRDDVYSDDVYMSSWTGFRLFPFSVIFNIIYNKQILPLQMEKYQKIFLKTYYLLAVTLFLAKLE